MVDYSCSVCGEKWRTQQNENYYDRPLDALLDTGSKWTDIIGNGSEPHFTIVSQRVLEIWESEDIGKFPAFSVAILPPYKKMKEPPLMYYRLDYKKMEGAELDFDESGFINLKYCNVCQHYSYDWLQSDRMANAKITPYVLKEETWNGANIFRPQYPVGYMFCTEKVVDCAFKHKLTNFRFVPCEIGEGVGFSGADYSTKNWRKKLEKQIEEFRKNFRPVDPETGYYIQ